jgi:hypothetical protein
MRPGETWILPSVKQAAKGKAHAERHAKREELRRKFPDNRQGKRAFARAARKLGLL